MIYESMQTVYSGSIFEWLQQPKTVKGQFMPNIIVSPDLMPVLEYPDVTPAQIKDLHSIGAIPKDVEVFASRADWGAQPGSQAAAAPGRFDPSQPSKYWVDVTMAMFVKLNINTGRWYIFRSGLTTTLGYAQDRVSGSINWSGAQHLTTQAARFDAYGPSIPLFRLVYMPASIAGVLNIPETAQEPGRAVVETPLGYLLPDEVGPIDFIENDPRNGGPRVQDWTEAANRFHYRATFPSDWFPWYDVGGKVTYLARRGWVPPERVSGGGNAGGGGGAVSPAVQEFLNRSPEMQMLAVRALLALPDSQAAMEIRKLYGR